LLKGIPIDNGWKLAKYLPKRGAAADDASWIAMLLELVLGASFRSFKPISQRDGTSLTGHPLHQPGHEKKIAEPGVKNGGAGEEPVGECMMNCHESDFVTHFTILVVIECALGLRGCRRVNLHPMKKIAHSRIVRTASVFAMGYGGVDDSKAGKNRLMRGIGSQAPLKVWCLRFQSLAVAAGKGRRVMLRDHPAALVFKRE
jgi:hypothetical protein